MGLSRTIFKNSLWLTISEAISKLASFFIIIWLARYFLPELYGQWTWALSFVSLFAVLADFGFATLTIRDLAQDKSRMATYLSHIILIKILLALVTLVLIASSVWLFKPSLEVFKLVILLGIYIIVVSFVNFFQAVFRAHEKMQYEALVQIVQNLLLLGLVAYSIYHKADLAAVSIDYIISTVIGMLLALIFIRIFFTRFRLYFNWSETKKILQQAWPFALSFIAITIYYYLGSVILGVIKNNEAVGWYRAAYNVFFLALTAQVLFYNVIFPISARLFKESLSKMQELLHNTIWLALLGSIGGTFLIVLTAADIIQILFRAEYSAAVPALQILIWNFVIICVNGIHGTLILNVAGQQKLFLRGVLIGAITNIIFNLILIPYFSLVGAALATVITEIAVCIYMYYAACRIITVHWLKYFYRPFLAGLISFGILFFWGENFSFIGTIMVYIICFSVFALLFKAFTISQIKILLKNILIK